MIHPALTPLHAYQFAQRVALREVQMFGPQALTPAQRTPGGWWTPMFPAIYLVFPRAKRNR